MYFYDFIKSFKKTNRDWELSQFEFDFLDSDLKQT